jgi:hypothetical protein
LVFIFKFYSYLKECEDLVFKHINSTKIIKFLVVSLYEKEKYQKIVDLFDRFSSEKKFQYNGFNISTFNYVASSLLNLNSSKSLEKAKELLNRSEKFKIVSGSSFAKIILLAIRQVCKPTFSNVSKLIK